MKRFLVILLLLLFTLPVFAENTILILGDSLSAGYGLDPESGWVKLLEQRLNYHYKVINSSISGDTTSNGLSRLPQALNTYHPQVTIIELGANDGLRGMQIPQITNNLNKLILLAINAKSKVLVLGLRLPLNYGVIYDQKFQQIFSDLAKRNDIRVVPNFLAGIDRNPNLFQADGLHPNAQAQSMILNNVWTELEKLLGQS